MSYSLSPRMPSPSRSAGALTLLLARYVAGQVAETQLFGLSNLLDEADATADERAAFASFYLEALNDGEDLALPKADELNEFLGMTRA